MSFKEEFRSFFVLYNNGEVFYFTINKKGEIYCNEFSKLFGIFIPAAYFIEFTENGFNLQDENGNKIYSLEDYKNTLNILKTTSLLTPEDPTSTERIYMDEDVRSELLENGKLKYNEKSCNIPGLLCEPVEENTYTKTRHK